MFKNKFKLKNKTTSNIIMSSSKLKITCTICNKQMRPTSFKKHKKSKGHIKKSNRDIVSDVKSNLNIIPDVKLLTYAGHNFINLLELPRHKDEVIDDCQWMYDIMNREMVEHEDLKLKIKFRQIQQSKYMKPIKLKLKKKIFNKPIKLKLKKKKKIQKRCPTCLINIGASETYTEHLISWSHTHLSQISQKMKFIETEIIDDKHRRCLICDEHVKNKNVRSHIRSNNHQTNVLNYFYRKKLTLGLDEKIDIYEYIEPHVIPDLACIISGYVGQVYKYDYIVVDKKMPYQLSHCNSMIHKTIDELFKCTMSYTNKYNKIYPQRFNGKDIYEIIRSKNHKIK